MADLRDREVAVSEKNDSRFGPSGTKARLATSFYLLVGGSSEAYDVTLNFESANGHWCQKESGPRCHGNGNGKSRTYGKPSERDKHNPTHWCKHVSAAMAATEQLAEAQERTAKAFGQAATPKPVAKPTIEPVAITQTVSSARDRLAAIEVEAAAIRADVAGRVAALVAEFGPEAVKAAIEAA
jgi:hypothetical protein